MTDLDQAGYEFGKELARVLASRPAEEVRAEILETAERIRRSMDGEIGNG